MRKVLIVGAMSAIAEATSRIFAKNRDYLYLVGRNAERLDAIAADLRVRGCPKVEIEIMDANDFDEHEAMLDRAETVMGGLDIVLIAHGTLSDQKACQVSVELTMQEIKTNALSVISLLTHIANRFEQRRKGTIAILTSVAGDRGRQNNYVYGSAKSMLATFASGLRQRLYKAGVSVTTIKLGFVDTPMTRDFNKGILWATPKGVGAVIAANITCGREIYIPWFWRIVMGVIKTLPTAIFKRIVL